MVLLKTRQELVCIKYGHFAGWKGKEDRQTDPFRLPTFEGMKLVTQNVENPVNDFKILSWFKMHVPSMKEHQKL